MKLILTLNILFNSLCPNAIFSTCNQYKVINKIFSLFFLWVFYTDGIPQSRLVTFLERNGHMWLVAIVLVSTGLVTQDTMILLKRR